MKKSSYGLLLLFLLLSPKVFSQAQDTLTISDLYGTGLYLNSIMAQDTAGTLPWHNATQRGADTLSWQGNRRVYVLKMNGTYPTNAVFVVKSAGRKFKVRAEYGVPAVKGSVYKPLVTFYPTSSGTPSGNFAQATALLDTIDLKNIMITGYNEDLPGNLDNLQGAILNIGSTGSGSIFVDSCLLKTTNGNHIRTDGRAYTVRVTNSIFADMGFLGNSNFGSGKAIDIRNVEVDTLDMQNNTFVNANDRIVRHYLALKPLHNFWFNHNTVVNSLSYHGFLSLGWLDSTGAGTFQIKNNVLIDHFALGCDTDVTRQVEFADPGENDPLNANPRMAWVVARANANIIWNISNNYYAITDSGAAMRALTPPTYVAAKAYANDAFLTFAENKRVAQLGGDTTATFKKVAITATKTPLVMTNMIRWYYTSTANGGAGKLKTGGNSVAATNFTKTSPGVWTYDFNRRGIYWYHDSLDCSIHGRSVTVASMVSSDSKVVGDPRWGALVTGVKNEADGLPTSFSLQQNYPNPFNPSTKIEYTLQNAGNVTLKVYNLLGQAVATLVNEKQDVGPHIATFDASKFTSGVYFYQINAGNYTATKKMILMK